MASRETRAALDYVGDVLLGGIDHPAYDGLRVIGHRNRLSRFLAGQGLSITPVSVELWPSLTCDARCPTCPYRLSGARDVVDRTGELELLTLSHAREILAGLRMNAVQSIIFTGGGEPLLNPAISSIVREARRNGLAWALFTNGLSLTRDLARHLLEHRPRFLRVSLDAGSPEYHAKTYALPPSMFLRVVNNVRDASLTARELDVRGFGLGFTLSPKVPAEELSEIRQLLQSLLREVGSGLSMVAFRPRVIHYRGRTTEPVHPQPRAGRYVALAEQIFEDIVTPLMPIANDYGTRLDVKKGLFRLADQREFLSECVSSPWMTNLDTNGYGYITSELAGVNTSALQWGRVVRRQEFREAWGSDLRMKLSRKLETGELRVPMVHRTSPVNLALLGLKSAVNGPVDMKLAEEIASRLCESFQATLSNSDFV